MQIKFPTMEEIQEDQAFTDKVLSYKYFILAGVVAFVILALVFSNSGVKKMSRERDFLTMSHSLELLKRGSQDFDASHLSQLLKNYPESTVEFDHYLRDSELVNGNQAEARGIENRILKRLSYLPSLYLTFAQAVQLIEDENFKEALEQLAQIRAQIEREGIENYPRLYCITLSRLAFLQGELGFDEIQLDLKQQLKGLMSGENPALGSRGIEMMQKEMENDPKFFNKILYK